MTKKPNPIAKHKEKDLILCREELLKIINADVDGATALKVKVEAIKSLGRFHHALQVEKITAKADARAGAAVAQLTPDVQAKIDKDIEEILERNRIPATEDPCLMS